MRVRWTGKAVQDIGRLHDFLAQVNRPVAASTVRSLRAAPARLLDNPRLGLRLEEFAPREVRRILIGAYELRYELLDDSLIVLRLWHAREDR